jgi:hypothetical protein
VAEPEITTTEIVSGDQFVVIASDGLWDVFTSQEAIDFVTKVSVYKVLVVLLLVLLLVLNRLDDIHRRTRARERRVNICRRNW